MNKREAVLLAIILIGATVLFFKSLYLDEVNPLQELDRTFKSDVYAAVEEQYGHSKVISYKLVTIKAEEKEDTVKYIGKVRKYFLYVIPFSEFRITIDYSKERWNDGKKN